MRLLPVFLLLFFLTGYSQEMPPVTNFDTREYSAGNQNWMLSQGEDKHIYVGNNSGLLEYTGERWTLYRMPDGSSVRSVLASGERIYTGSHMDFGYWERLPTGCLEYKSLKDSADTKILDGEQFWHIRELEGYVVFQSHRRLYSYNKTSGRINTIVTEENISNLFRIQDKIFYQVAGKGLFAIENGAGKLFIPGSEIGNKPIVGLFPFSAGRMLAVTRDDGLFTIEGDKWKAYPVENYPNSKTFFNSIYLQDGTLVLGSIGSGLYIMNLRSTENYHLSQPSILNNTVLSIMEDEAGNIWGGLDNGLTVINIDSPFRLFTDTFGKVGTVYCSYRLGDLMYLGTNQGLYYKKLGSTENYALVPGTSGQVWSINYVNNDLYIGHDRGTFLINGTNARHVWDGLGTWSVKPLGKGIIQGHYSGLTYLPDAKKGGSFRPIENFELSSRNIVVENDSVIWVGHYHKGVFRLKLNEDFSGVKEVENYIVSYEGTLGLQVFSFNDSIYYSTENSVYRYLPEKDEFTADNRLNSLIQGQQRITGVSEVLGDETWWTFGKDNLYYITRDDLERKLVSRAVPLPLEYRGIAEGFENISRVGNNEYLVGANIGYTRFELPLEKKPIPNLSITTVETAVKGEGFSTRPLDIAKLELENEMNFVNFYFSIPNYGKLASTRYSYRILNYSSNWSPWSSEGDANFKNLPPGNYTFQVKGKFNDQVTDPVSYSFTIAQPWYFTTLAIVSYVFLFILLLIGIHFAYKRHHNKLMKEKERNLRMQNLEAEQKIIKLQNEHLERDMAEKNRELAASTMSLIKKNEFLTDIKEKLKKSDSSQGVIRTIDKEISEEDNWNYFKEAFSNADKDFFNKLKKLHPELTSNDLRLCAYLRLNLSSKEIAPLLNISVKSVEIKRYRLRKKMELGRNTNLTDYILEI